MASLSAFFGAPSVAFMDGCKKEQLVKIAEHYGIVVSGSTRKDDIKNVILASLFERGVLQKSELGAEEPLSVPVLAPAVVQMPGLSLEQQKEILAMQFEMGKIWQQNREKERQLEVVKLELKHSKLQLIREGKLSSGEFGPVSSASDGFDIISNLRIVPKFNERDPDTFFILFEHVAEARCWSDSDKVLLLQCVLTGRAQEAY